MTWSTRLVSTRGTGAMRREAQLTLQRPAIRLRHDVAVHVLSARAAMLYDEREAGGTGAKLFRYDFVQNDLQGLRGTEVLTQFRAQVIDAMVCQIQHMKRQLAP
jgi:hypothetical protein